MRIAGWKAHRCAEVLDVDSAVDGIDGHPVGYLVNSHDDVNSAEASVEDGEGRTAAAFKVAVAACGVLTLAASLGLRETLTPADADG